MQVHLPLERELCPFDLAPVTSTAIQMIFGDTVAIALMQVGAELAHAVLGAELVNAVVGGCCCPVHSACPPACTAALSSPSPHRLPALCPRPHCLQAKHLTRDQYAMNHPAGRIGKRLMLHVSDVMLK